jgi:hypothetical protein
VQWDARVIPERIKVIIAPARVINKIFLRPYESERSPKIIIPIICPSGYILTNKLYKIILELELLSPTKRCGKIV